ncbi:type VI secretion system Vgr family protein [Paraburkholderia megapolitana]|uniref:type VI secretion system Vgr family protein n=1 Tax=Paraburkholderia megapolitana TaxID=420953 RepID=UPI0038BAFE9E
MSFGSSNDAPGGSLPGIGNSLGGLAGSLASGVASHLGPLGGLVSQVNTLQRAAQLAHTGFSLLGKTPESIAGAINSATGGPARLTQENRYVTLETPLGPDVLLVSAAVIDENVNALPAMHLDLLAHKHDLSGDALIGQRVKVRLSHQPPQSMLGRVVASSSSEDDFRYFDGYVMSFDRVGNPGKVTQYQMTVVPWFALLTRSTDCRIFQNLTARDILAQIFQEHGFSDFVFHLRITPKPIEYIVMYQESYYNFCARLMEQEGLIWTHRYEKDKHMLAIGDMNYLFQPIDGLKTLAYSTSDASKIEGCIDRLNEGRHFGVGKVTFQDFNHQNPSSPLMKVDAIPQNSQHALLDQTERYEHQSLYDHSDDGTRYARYAMEAEEAQAHRYTGSGYAWRLTTAGTTTVTGHPVEANNREYVFLQVRHEAVNDYTQHAAELPYRNTFVCLPSKIPYRAERRTPKPLVQGTQSAIVVGPKGEQIHTNGSCVKLHFIWDRRGRMDGSDSMWIRISQPWAGDGWGAAAIPRIGQEVNVSFNQGDPDNPLIIGRVYNGEQGNPYHGAGGQTMGIKSQTHKGDGSNELRMSDVNGAQELYLHAQKDMNTVVKNNQTHTIESGNRTIKVLKGDVIKHVGTGNLTETIAKVRSSTATAINTKAIGGEAGPGEQSHQATDSIEHRVGAGVVTMLPDSIKLSLGPSSVLINASGIYIDGPVIHLNQNTLAPPAPLATTGLGADVDALAAKSPGLQKDLDTLQKAGFKISYGAPGSGSTTDRAKKTISLDGNLKNNTSMATQTLAHEAGHAMYPYTPDYSSKTAFVNGTLADEGAATMSNIRAQREILANGGPDIGIAGNSANAPVYNKAYDQFLQDGNAAAARQAIGSQYGQGETTSNTHQPYGEYYGSWYDKNFPPKN